jgi:hypothetical protein
MKPHDDAAMLQAAMDEAVALLDQLRRDYPEYAAAMDGDDEAAVEEASRKWPEAEAIGVKIGDLLWRAKSIADPYNLEPIGDDDEA